MKKTVWILFFALLFIGVSFLQFISKEVPLQWENPALIPKAERMRFLKAVSLIESNYVDEIKTSKLVTGALTGMLKSLDPYSYFLDADAYQELKMDANGQFGGLGLEVSVKGGFLHVIAPLDDSPAEQAGVKAGDMIIKIDEVPTRDMTLNDAVKKMRGAPGSAVKLSLMREGANPLIELSVPRRIVTIKSIKETKLLEDQIGYIRLSAFQDKSAEDLRAAILKLQSEGMSGLILDLRNNAGGLLSSAVSVAEEFMPPGKVIVSTKGRNPKKSQTFVSQAQSPFRIFPWVVLVNKGSASSSEIVAGVVQDHRLGFLLGTKTFGKGSIQTLVPLPDGTAIRLTTSKYYTPNGRLIHDVGILPDIVVEEGKDPSQDVQLNRAVELIRELKSKAPETKAA